jgi:hypothetical protein
MDPAAYPGRRCPINDLRRVYEAAVEAAGADPAPLSLRGRTADEAAEAGPAHHEPVLADHRASWTVRYDRRLLPGCLGQITSNG